MPKSTADVAFVNPEIVKWAIEGSKLSRKAIAQKLKVTPDQLQLWESGTQPPFKKAEALAKLLNIPFGYLFLHEPPPDTLPLPDLRSRDRRQKPSQEFLQLLNDVLVKQDWYRDHLRESERAPKLKFVGSFDSRSNERDVANNIRATLGITAALRTGVSSWSEYLSTLSRNAEAAGILVMRSSIVGNNTQRHISTDEVQGFAIADEYAPVIFVNSGDYKAAQIFTLAHELVHIWIGQSGIGEPNQVATSTNRIEAFCNRVAASVLVPQSEFQGAWRTVPETDARLNVLAKRFWVSTLVILRRAYELELISSDQYFKLWEQELEKVNTGKKQSGGDYYRNIGVRMSPKFTYTVLGEVNRNALLLRDGARLLGVSVPILAKFAGMAR